jgi:hypothetical protein
MLTELHQVKSTNYWRAENRHHCKKFEVMTRDICNTNEIGLFFNVQPSKTLTQIWGAPCHGCANLNSGLLTANSTQPLHLHIIWEPLQKAATVIDRDYSSHYAGQAGCVVHFISEAWQLETPALWQCSLMSVKSRLLTRCLLSHKKRRGHCRRENIPGRTQRMANSKIVHLHVWCWGQYYNKAENELHGPRAKEQRNKMVRRLAYLHLHRHCIHTYILKGMPKLWYKVTHIFCITFS